MLGLEGAEATGAGTVLVWGWLVDPLNEVRGIGCDLAGRTGAVELLDRIPRPDLAEMLASVLPRTSEPGFVGLVQSAPDALRAAGGRLALTLDTGHGSARSANRLLFEPEAAFGDTVGRRLPVTRMRPLAVARAAEALQGPELRRTLEQADGRVEQQDFGPAGRASLSLVIPIAGDLPVGGDKDALRQTLAYLDMDPDGPELEVVLALTQGRDWPAVERAVLNASTDLRILIVRAGEALSVGAAARVGLEAASAPVVALMAEAVVPPTRDWMRSAGAQLETAAFAAPAAMPRFDGLTHRPGARVGLRAATDWSHDEVSMRIERAVERSGLNQWSPGLVVGRRDAFLRSDIAWAGVAGADAFWDLLLDAAVSGGAVPLPSGGRFTLVPGAPNDDEIGAGLLDAYELARVLESRAPQHALAAE